MELIDRPSSVASLCRQRAVWHFIRIEAPYWGYMKEDIQSEINSKAFLISIVKMNRGMVLMSYRLLF